MVLWARIGAGAVMTLERMKAVRSLAQANAVRDAHAAECPDWDFEGNGGCFVCEDLDNAVRKARSYVNRQQPETV